MLLSRTVYKCLHIAEKVNAQFDFIPTTIPRVSIVLEIKFEFKLFYETKANSKTTYTIFSKVMYFKKVSAFV